MGQEREGRGGVGRRWRSMNRCDGGKGGRKRCCVRKGRGGGVAAQLTRNYVYIG